MAVFTATFDTETKAASFSVDGVPIENVSSISMYERYRDYDSEEDAGYEISVSTEVKKNPTTGMRERTYMFANASEGATKAAATEKLFESAIAGFVQTKPKVVSNLKNDVAAFFGGE